MELAISERDSKIQELEQEVTITNQSNKNRDGFTPCHFVRLETYQNLDYL